MERGDSARPGDSLLWRLHRISRTQREFLRIGFESLQNFCYPAFELRVFSLNHPIAGRRSAGSFRNEDLAAINERPAPSDADHTAPRTFSDEWAESRLAEHVRKNISVRGR